MTSVVPLYDEFSADYDRFVDWPSRLLVELPFLHEQLQSAGAHSVLDAACGTGAHALALSRRGYQVVGADLSLGMIMRARQRAQELGEDARFVVAGFGETRAVVEATFDAVLCLGNSLPHALTVSELQAALYDWWSCLRPGGVLLVQMRNFDSVLDKHDRWMDPQYHREGAEEWIFLRFYDFSPDGLLVFNVLTLHRAGSGSWSQRVASTRLRPIVQSEMQLRLSEAGFGTTQFRGDMEGHAFDPQTSPNLVVVARRTGKPAG